MLDGTANCSVHTDSKHSNVWRLVCIAAAVLVLCSTEQFCGVLLQVQFTLGVSQGKW